MIIRVYILKLSMRPHPSKMVRAGFSVIHCLQINPWAVSVEQRERGGRRVNDPISLNKNNYHGWILLYIKIFFKMPCRKENYIFLEQSVTVDSKEVDALVSKIGEALQLHNNSSSQKAMSRFHGLTSSSSKPPNGNSNNNSRAAGGQRCIRLRSFTDILYQQHTKCVLTEMYTQHAQLALLWPKPIRFCHDFQSICNMAAFIMLFLNNHSDISLSLDSLVTS